MIKNTFVTILLFVIWLAPVSARSDQTDMRLDPLFAALKASSDLEMARGIEQQIWEIWGETKLGQQTILYEQGNSAMASRDFLGAIAYFSQLVEVAPDFAEAWNKRATVYYLVDKFDESIDDIQRTLALEPRHFGALSGLGLIMMRLDQLDLALKSFEAAIEIHPHMPAAKVHIKMLSERVQGEPL